MTPRRRIPDVLPPPATQPLAPEALERAVGRRRAGLLRRCLPDAPLLAAMVSATTADTGSWFGRRRVALAFTADSLLLFAGGPRPLCHRASRESLKQTQYNTVTGELVFASADLPVRTIALSPLQASRALAQITAPLN